MWLPSRTNDRREKSRGGCENFSAFSAQIESSTSPSTSPRFSHGPRSFPETAWYIKRGFGIAWSRAPFIEKTAFCPPKTRSAGSVAKVSARRRRLIAVFQGSPRQVRAAVRLQVFVPYKICMLPAGVGRVDSGRVFRVLEISSNDMPCEIENSPGGNNNRTIAKFGIPIRLVHVLRANVKAIFCKCTTWSGSKEAKGGESNCALEYRVGSHFVEPVGCQSGWQAASIRMR